MMRASCHCGAVELALDLPDGLGPVIRCDCSMCRRKGTIMAGVPLSALTVLKGADALRLYQFHSKTAKHWFCGICGIYTHHQRRIDPNQYGVNVGCIEGVDLRALEPVPWSDGVNHPKDNSQN